MADQLINQVLWPLIYILCIVLPLVIAVAMFVYWERKVIGWMHVRLGPNKIGPFGMLQAFADVVKLLIKEVILPTKANRFLYFMAPLLALIPALAAWAVIPFSGKNKAPMKKNSGGPLEPPKPQRKKGRSFHKITGSIEKILSHHALLSRKQSTTAPGKKWQSAHRIGRSSTSSSPRTTSSRPC